MSSPVIASREVAEGYIGKVCFKTGPPSRVGVELEWTVHHSEDLSRALDPHVLSMALGEHAPPVLNPDSPHLPLSRGGVVTVEPGGQVEISTPASASLSRLLDDTASDITQLTHMLASARLTLGTDACDPYRPAQRLIDTARYQAMERAFDRIGPDGRSMMCGTAGLQVCLDAGDDDRAAARWNALHAVGPPLIALFANSPRLAGRHTGWASSRMRTWYGLDPARTRPPHAAQDPVTAWTRRALDTPLLCLRRPNGCWDAPPGVTFADWIAGALPSPPTIDDLDYHLGTMFPPVRPRGYFEIRYLDAQPCADWVLPVAMLTALFAREQTVDKAAEIAAPAADRWVEAARAGLSDVVIAPVAVRLAELACQALGDTDLSAPVATEVAEQIFQRSRRVGGKP